MVRDGRRGVRLRPLSPGAAPRFGRISLVQTGLVVLMVFAATGNGLRLRSLEAGAHSKADLRRTITGATPGI